MSKIKKLVIIMLHKYFMNDDYKTFDIDIIKNMGYDFEIWNLVSIMYFNTSSKPIDLYMGDESVDVNSFREFTERITQLNIKETFFLFYPGGTYDENTLKLKRIIKEKKGRYGNYYYPLTLVPNVDLRDQNTSRLQVIRYYYGRWKKNRVWMYEDIMQIIEDVKFSSSFDFVQGMLRFKYIPNKFLRFSKKTKVIHSFDYDCILRSKKVDLNFSNYVVFIDQFLSGHSDYAKLGLKPPVTDQERYFDELDQVFRLVERKYGCEVVIAAHPKAEYKGNEFRGRKIVIGNTSELIKNAELCIFHFSTCFATILLNKKEFIQLITTDLKQSDREKRIIDDYQKQGLSKICDISEVTEETLEQFINLYDEQIHRNFLRMYMVPDNDKKILNMQYICDCIKTLR